MSKNYFDTIPEAMEGIETVSQELAKSLKTYVAPSIKKRLDKDIYIEGSTQINVSENTGDVLMS